MTQNIVMAQPIVSSKRLSWYITILVIYGGIIAYGSFYLTQFQYLNTLASDIRSLKYDIKNVSNNINDKCQDYLYLTQFKYLNTLVSDIKSLKYDIKNVSNNINDKCQDYLYLTQFKYLNTLVSDIKSLKYDIKNVSNNINDNYQDYLYLMKKENTSKVKPIVEKPTRICSKIKKETVDKPKTPNKLNSNMTIIDLLNDKDLVKFIEPFLWEFHFIQERTHPFQKWLHHPKEIMCSIDYLHKNLYPSNILNVEYQKVKKKNTIMLKLPPNTYCYGKEHGIDRQNHITTNTGLHPCKEMEFERINAWCNVPMLFNQFIEIVKANEDKRLPNDVIKDISFFAKIYKNRINCETKIEGNLHFHDNYISTHKLYHIYMTPGCIYYYNKEIYYNMINLFNFYNSLNYNFYISASGSE